MSGTEEASAPPSPSSPPRPPKPPIGLFVWERMCRSRLPCILALSEREEKRAEEGAELTKEEGEEEEGWEGEKREEGE